MLDSIIYIFSIDHILFWDPCALPISSHKMDIAFKVIRRELLRHTTRTYGCAYVYEIYVCAYMFFFWWLYTFCSTFQPSSSSSYLCCYYKFLFFYSLCLSLTISFFTVLLLSFCHFIYGFLWQLHYLSAVYVTTDMTYWLFRYFEMGVTYAKYQKTDFGEGFSLRVSHIALIFCYVLLIAVGCCCYLL